MRIDDILNKIKSCEEISGLELKMLNEYITNLQKDHLVTSNELSNKNKEIEQCIVDNMSMESQVHAKEKVIELILAELIHMDDYGCDWDTEEYENMFEDEPKIEYLKQYFENKVKEK